MFGVPMLWVYILTGATGAYTSLFLLRILYRLLVPPPAAAAYFAPEGGGLDAIVGAVKSARREVLLAAGDLGHRALSEALVAAKLRGVQVEILLDMRHEL